jgi:pyridoxal phosphate enzyme (YggS family)
MIADNIRIVKEKIALAAYNAGREAQDIKLVAVSKHFPADAICEAFAAGQIFFGENYIQEIQSKRGLAPKDAVFHFIGHLQSNKAKFAVETCDMIETLDSYKLARALHNQLEKINRTLDVLIQVNIGNDPNKTGITADNAELFINEINALNRLKICGLMTMPPLENDPELSRPHFRNLRLLAERIMEKGLFPHVSKPELSMGMSDDFHIAIEEGATIVRVGTAIFGRRQ